MRGRGGYHIGRRQLLLGALTACAPARMIPDLAPSLRLGAQVGDVTSRTAVIWSASGHGSGEGARMQVVVNGRVYDGQTARPETDFTARTLVHGLPPGALVHYRVRFDKREEVEGSFMTAPEKPQRLRFAFSGDTNGQGWGIDPARGGMPAYAALEALKPDLFIHLGDTIYADNPIPPAIALPDGASWNNLVTPGKSRIAKTLADFRAAHLYPRLSAEFRRCSANVPLAAVWDDHEVHDNWFPGEDLDTDALAPLARRAMYDYLPTLRLPDEAMYRVLAYGPLADIFMLDGRSYRSPNEPAPLEGGLLGGAQAAWLVRALSQSRALWKIVACDMPIALEIGEPGKNVKWAADGWANEDGEPREREVEAARILSELKARGVKNVVWLGADVHYAAVHRFDPARAVYKDFDPFYELVAGPMHATTFGRKNLDSTFGPALEWCSVDWNTRGSPADGKQYIGVLEIDPEHPDLQVRFIDARGTELHRLVIPHV